MAKKNKRKYDFTQLANKNSELRDTYHRLFTLCKTIANNRYKWEGLPKGLESRMLEDMLLSNGQALFFKDNMLGVLCLKCQATENLNVYGEPTAYMVSGHGYSKVVSATESVRIMCNPYAVPDVYHIIDFAEKMAETENIIQQNLRQQRIPYIIVTSKEDEYSKKVFLDKLYTGDPAIFIDKTMTGGSNMGTDFVVMPTQTPYLVGNLTEYEYNLERKLLTYLGINTTIEKKERLLVDETNSNNGYIKMMIDIGLEQRQLACDKINEMFGTNIKVYSTMKELNEMDEEDMEYDDTENKGVE